MRILKIVALCSLLLPSQHVNAKDAAALGPGGFTCGQFAAEYGKNPSVAEDAFYVWAQGFMSGLNVARLTSNKLGKNLSALSNDEQKSHLRSFCSEKPLVAYGRAVFLLFESLPELKR